MNQADIAINSEAWTLGFGSTGSQALASKYYPTFSPPLPIKN